MSNDGDPDTCTKLRELIQDYHRRALAVYEGIPPALSLMTLTIMELYVASDRSACNQFRLLGEFWPEIDIYEFQCLSLPLKDEMERAHKVEEYLRQRKVEADPARLSLFRDFGDKYSFAVSYFDDSIALQNLLEQIERNASVQRKQTCEELDRLKRRYKELMTQYDNSRCQTVKEWDHYKARHVNAHRHDCSRCALKKQAETLRMAIFEWPLSSKKSEAKATVFELQIPQTFSDWRDTSMYVISDVLATRPTEREPPTGGHYILTEHHGISHLISPGYERRRIVPLSSVKPHSVTHRKTKRGAILNVTEDDVCLENALRYAYYDNHMRIWSRPHKIEEEMLKKYIPRFPQQSKSLRRYLYKLPKTPDGILPNAVIAEVSNCLTHMSLDEFRALAEIPYGCNNIYANILVQLASSAVDFTKAETQILILHTIHRTDEPNDAIERCAHNILTETRFCQAIVAQLERCMELMEKNWETWRAAATFAEISKRVLSLTTTEDLQQRVLTFLVRVRIVCMKWITRLQESANASTDTQQRNNLRSFVGEIALLGANTFAVDEKFWNSLFQCQKAVSMLIKFSIVFQELAGSINSESDHHFRIMAQTWKSFMYNIFPTLVEAVDRDSSGLNEAIKISWAAFEPSTTSTWVLKGQWVHITSETLPVHFNLLTAELLVNGLPLARLPAQYATHPMHHPLFRNHVLEVVPTAEPGMRFSAKTAYQGHELHFGMIGEDMLILAKKDNIS